MTYEYIRSEPSLWTVGFYRPDGKWEPESDHGSPDEAAQRVAWLNGGGQGADPTELAAVTRHRDYLQQQLAKARKEAAGRKEYGIRLKAEVTRLREQVKVIRQIGEAETARAAYEAMDTERRGWESRRAVENVTLAELTRDRDRARDAAVALEQEVAAVTRHRNYLAQRLNAVTKEATGRKAHGDRLKAEKDAAHAYARRLLAERDTVARAVRSPHLTDAEKLAEIREAIAVIEGEREEADQ